jgi:DNA mismatch repair protein MutL
MGFRGEALASIAGVGQVTLQSRPSQAPSGAELKCDGGVLGPVKPWNGSPGTRIEVKHLFYNVPVRKKFLKSVATELGHVCETITRIALANPTLHLTLRHNGRLVYDIPATAGLLDRIALFFTAEVRDALYEIDSGDGPLRVRGFVADPRCDRGNAKFQYFFVNGRWFRDRSLAHALQESYRGLIMSGRYAVGFLFLTIPPEQVDVNVHPTKAEVRFQENSLVYSLVRSTIKRRLLRENLIPHLTPPQGQEMGFRLSETAEVGEAPIAPTLLGEPTSQTSTLLTDRDETPTARAEDHPVRSSPPRRPSLSDFSTLSEFPTVGFDSSHLAGGASVAEDSSPVRATTQLADAALPSAAPESTPQPRPHPATLLTPALPQPRSESSPPVAFPKAVSPTAIQLHDSYLVLETSEGMLVIDQHALHERILYEQLRCRIREGQLEVQRLLIPEPIDLPAEQAALVLEAAEALRELGLEVSDFGGNTILLSSYPTLLGRKPPHEILRGVVDHLITQERPPTKEALLHLLMATMACKAAIKAGDKLTPEEIAYLLHLREMAEDSHHCPHGRPTSLLFSRAELDRQFRRS